MTAWFFNCFMEFEYFELHFISVEKTPTSISGGLITNLISDRNVWIKQKNLEQILLSICQEKMINSL